MAATKFFQGFAIPCSTSPSPSPLVLHDIDLPSLLNSFLKDLNRAAGDLGDSSAATPFCLATSITIFPPVSPSPAPAGGGEEVVEEEVEEVEGDVDPSSTRARPAITWSSLPQNSTLVGMPVVVSGGAWPETGAGAGETVLRQSGQLEWDRNHMSMHSKWNPWLQLGSNLAFSPSDTSHKHTEHSIPSL